MIIMRQKMFVLLLLIIIICFLIASVLVNYFSTGMFLPEKVVASVLSLP